MKPSILAALVAATACAAPTSALAEIMIQDAYGRVATPVAKAGAVFLEIHNSGAEADRLIAVESTAAARVEIHTHKETDGVMQMRQVEGGVAIPAQGMHALQRGGDHVMFMGLTGRWTDGDEIPLTLIFEQAGAVPISVTVDSARKPKHGHSGH